jgi:glycosyltransferase involved in cell wall biosynthesis
VNREYDIVYLPLGAAAYGGAEHSLLDLAHAMAGLGRSVLVLAEPALRTTSFARDAAARGIQVEWVNWASGDPRIKVFLAAWRTFRHIRPRIIHFNISWRRSMWLVALAARLFTRASTVGTMRAIPERRTSVPSKRHLLGLPGIGLWYVPDLVRGRIWAALLDDTVSVNRAAFPERLVREFGFSASHVHVIYNGLHLPSVPLNFSERERCRSARGFAPKDFVVAYVGRLTAVKGVDVLLQAFARLRGAARLWVIGDGEQEAELRILAGELGIADRVRFEGYTDAAATLVGAADVCAVPSLWEEAFGRVLVESLAQAVPVVASRIGGMQELLDDGIHGFLVPPADVAALAASLQTFADDTERRLFAGHAGRRMVQQRFSIERVVAEYQALYDTMRSRR